MAQMTVGIPAYKTTYLVQAIASVLEQTFTDFELLISDDSPDGAVSDIIRRFQDPRIRLVQGPRAGLAANCAHVWDNAATDLLKFLCDDDLLVPTALADLLGVLRKNQDYVFAFGRRSIIDHYGRVLRKPLGFLGDNWVWFEPTALADNLVHEIDNDLAELSSLLIRRSAFEDASCLTGYAGLPIRRLIDVAFLMNAAERGPSVATCQLVASIRDHPNQVSARTDAPDISAGLFEWEIFLRGGVERGVVAADRALLGLPNLQRLYRRRGRGLGEIVQFQKGLPALEDLLATGQPNLITERFRNDLDIADYMIKGRLAAAASQPTAADAAAETTQFQGKVEYISRDHARGWAWAPEASDRTVQVVALIDDRIIGHAIANQDRRDLADWNIGSGRHGFDMTFYEPLLSDVTPSFRLFSDAEDWRPEPVKLAPLDRSTLATGGDSARAALREHARFTEQGPRYEDFQWDGLAGVPDLPSGKAPLVAAFYLPQFYAMPENDRFWGTGFTEWRQLPRAVPRFPGHYQPRIPRDLGFYNLLDVEVMARQAAMAKAAGIGAFGYYYYWFDKQRVLERPVELMLESSIEMPFFIIWANENWTRQWDGSEHEVLLKQDYRREDEDALLADLARHMLDPRYVRMEGRPLFVIYNPEPIPDIRNTIARWRETWSSKFGLKPLIFMAQTFSRLDPRPYGLDGALEFPPHKLGQYAPRRDVVDAYSRDFAGQVIQYDDFVAASLSEPASGFPLVKTAVPSWDNEARRPNRGVILEGSSPQKYQDWLQALVENAIDNPVFGTPLVAINAWNEWAEGAYLEPDIHFGSSYLNATARAVKGAIEKKHAELPPPRVERRKRAPGSGPAVATMDKFLIIGMPRTGSTLVQTTLSQHPGVKVYGELFHWVAAEREGPHAIITPAGPRSFQPETEHAIDFLEDHVWNAENNALQAVGFKLFGEHMEGQGDLFLRIKSEFPGLKLIYVWRENLLDVLLSRRVAEQTGEWVRWIGETGPGLDQPLKISIPDAESFFSLHLEMRDRLESHTCGQPTLHVSYEDLAADFEGVARRMFDFLGVEALAVKPAMQKQSARTARETLENWDELKAHFAGTPFADFFVG